MQGFVLRERERKRVYSRLLKPFQEIVLLDISRLSGEVFGSNTSL
jgi:hypothetical protein